MMLFVFDSWSNPSLFQTGWFVESLLTQTLIIHIIRTHKVPWVQSRASWQLTVASISVCVAGAWLPYSPLAPTLGLTPLPLVYWLCVLPIVGSYLVLMHLLGRWWWARHPATTHPTASHPTHHAPSKSAR
jgi:Mg2+-importing ATPase